VETLNVKFSNKDRSAAAFIKDLKKRVNDHFETTQVSKKANAEMVIKTIAILGITFVPYALILSNQFTPWQMLLLAIVMGIGVAGVGFSIAHDALHGAYTSSNRINTLLGFSFDLMGANGYLWKITHNVIHHTYTNIQGIDEDLEVSPLLRLSPESEHRPIHRYQHIFGFAAYSFSTLYWVFIKDYKYFLQRDLGPYQNIRHPRTQIAILIATKIVYYTYMIVIPLLVLEIAWWQYAIGFVAMHLTAGLILGVVFQLAHVVEGPMHVAAGNNDTLDDAWLVHEMKTTANFARRNKLLCWYVGGLNFQIEHHLFPKICSIHYPAISPIVQQVAEEHGVPYHHHPTLSKAIASHYRMLKRLSEPDMQLAGELARL